jgi:hypothetical protein
MRCIFCLRDFPENSTKKEHVFPYAIGGCLTTERVCEHCNSKLGHSVDVGLTDHPLVMIRRCGLQLAGKSGKIPEFFGDVYRDGVFEDDPSLRIKLRINPQTTKLEGKIFPRIRPIESDEGNPGLDIAIDTNDTATLLKLPDIIQRARKKRGFRALTDDEMTAQIRTVTSNEKEITSRIKHSIYFDDDKLRRAIYKIAYELSCLWRGDIYLEDEDAQLLREAISSDEVDSLRKIAGKVTAEEQSKLFPYWTSDKNSHLAYSFCVGNDLAICVRIFNLFAAIVYVTPEDRRIRL